MLVISLLPAPVFAAAGDLTLFGPKRYERAQGKPWVFTDNFNGCANSGGQALLRVQNGANRDSSLSSAVITLNGTSVLVEADFKNQTAVLERTVTIHPGSNTIATQLKSGGQKETPFLVVTVIGLGCDSTPPVISAPRPTDGALLNTLRPAIAASYADNSGGAGIDTASLRVTLDGGDITSACTVGETSVSCTPAADLPEGGHNVTLALADLLQNPATLSWRFTTDTIAPRAAITTPADGQYLGARSVTVSGTVDDPTAVVTVNGKLATISGALFSVAEIPLNEGANTLTVSAVDPAGNKAESSINVTVDTSLPQVTVTSPVEGSFTGSSPIAVSGSVSELPVSVMVNGRAATIEGQAFALPQLPLTEGLNSLTVEALDRAGNKGTAIVTVNLDTVKPVISVTTPASGTLTRNSSLTVSGTVNEPVKSFALNGVAVPVSPALTFTATLSLTEGQNSIVLEAVDRAGNSGSATFSVTLDSTPPTVPTLEPLTTPTNVSPVTVSGSAEPLSSVSLYSGAERVATVVTPADGRLSFPGMVLKEGNNSFIVTALDAAGNESAPSAPVDVVLDTVKPVVGITAPLNKALLGSQTITLGGSIDDPAAVITVNGLAAINDGTSWTLEGFTLQEGSNTLLVEATDPAGNKGAASITVSLDTVIPVVTVATPVDGAWLATPQITVTGSVSEPVSLLTVNGQLATVTGLDFTAPVTLSEGANSITVEATDLAGNKGTATISVNLDTAPPLITISSPPGNLLTNEKQLTVSGSVNEPVAFLTVNGQPVAVNGLAFTTTLTLAEGQNPITVTAADRAGNNGSAAISVNLDSTPPALPALETLPLVTNTPETVIRGSAEPGSVVFLYSGATKLGEAVADATGTFTFPGVTLPEGESIFTVIARDAAGNDSQPSAPVHEVLDTRAPLVAIASPAAGAILGTPVITVSGSIDDPTAIITVGGRSAVNSGTGWTVADFTLQEGNNTLLVEARDAAGNTGSAAASVTLDTAAPLVTITMPANGLLTKTAQITVSGTVSEENTIVTVNGAPAVVSNTTFTATANLLEGQNSLSVKAVDRAGNSGSTSVSVTLDATAPGQPVLSPLQTPTNTAVVTINGTAEAGSTVRISSGGAIIATVAADSRGNFTLPNVTLAEGEGSYTAVATDAAGNDSIPSAPLSVVLDTVKPVITVTAPLAGVVIGSADVTISGSVSETVASLTINGASTPLSAGALTFTSTLSLAAGSNSALIIATDQAGNIATTTLTIVRDSTPPVVAITAPPTWLLTRNGTVQVSGTVDDAEAVLTVNGTAVTNSSKTFSFSYVLSDGDNAISVEATDRAGNRGSASVIVTLDAIVPTLAITAPAEAVAGANIAINLNAGDNRGLALAELKVDGVPIWSVSSVPSITETISYRLSPALNAGTDVTLQAKGSDSAGNETVATVTIRISQAAMGPGFLQGKALDDARGLKLEGATVAITDATAVTKELATAADGGWFLETPAGSALVRISRPGFTSVERSVTVIPEKNITVHDARLTKISETRNLVDAAGGTAKVGLLPSNPDPRSPFLAELTLPAGALGSSSDLRLTPVSNQGLAGLLPPGWSPLAAVDIRLLDPATGAALEAPFAGNANLKLPLPAGLTLDPASPPVLARYDETGRRWIVAGSVQLDGSQPSTLSPIPSAGQYALVLPDPAPAAPPTPVLGSNLQTSAFSLQSNNSLQPDFSQIVATGRVVPQALPPSTGLKAAGEVVLGAKEGAAPAFISGLVLGSRITEKFDLKSGDKVESPVYSQDLILYRYPCVTSIGSGAVSALAAGGKELRTTFPVSPSRDYTIVDLLLGKVAVEILKPDSAEIGVMVGSDGGRLVDGDGNILLIPEGALGQATPVSTRTASVAEGTVGSDFALIRAVEVNLTRQTLAIPATLSIPAPDGFNPSLPLIVAKQIEVKGVAKLKLVSLARQSGTLISSTPLSPELTNSTNSINSSGVYYFLQAKAPLGFVTGTVTDAANSAYTGALVKTDNCSLVDLAGASGRYLLAAPVAPFTATALDLYKNDEVSEGSAVTFANQVVTLDLKIEKIPPTVTAITPANGAVNVQPTVPVVVTFSKQMDQSSINSQTLRIINSANSEPVPGSYTFSIDNRTVTFYPAEAFRQETGYSVTVAAAVKDLQGYPLGSDTTAAFTVRKTTPPPMPPAGSISATFPDVDGFITVTATQGSADPADTVLLMNDTSGEIVSVTPASNGSFSGKVRGQLGDEIKVVLMDYSGNQTVISYLTFKNTDGSYLVTAKGGKLEGEGGSILDIPEGALAGPTIIKLTALPEANLPSQLQAPGQYLAAFNIDSGGMPFRSEVKLSMPLPAGFDPATPVFLTRPGTVYNGDGTSEQVYEVIDSTKVIDGRITTASPPFDGVMSFGSYVFTGFPTVSVGIVSGYTYQDMNGQPGYQPTVDGSVETPTRDAQGNLIYQYDKPVRNAVIRTPSAWNYVSYSNSKGFYSGMTTLYGNVGAGDLEYKVTGIHPLTMQRETKTGWLNANGNIRNLNFKLAEKITFPPDSAAPTIDMSLAVAPVASSTSRIIAGTVKTGTPLSLSVVVTDQQLEWATLDVSYTAPGASPIPIPATIKQSGMGQITAPDGKILTRYLYTCEFAAAAGLISNYVTPDREGTYKFTIAAKDLSKNQSSRTISIRSVLDGSSLGSGIEGAPTIDAVIPSADSKDIMVTAPIMVWFSEPVENVNETTFVLLDSTTGIKVPATVSSGLEGGRMQATLTPKGNLYYARKYEIRLTNNITDAYDNTGGSRMNLASYSSFFTTKEPKGYDLATDQQFTGGRDIALYTFTAEDGESTTYAYVLAGENGWRIVDVTDPTAPEVIHSASPSCDTRLRNDCRYTPSSFSYRSVAIDQEKEIMAITENILWPDGVHFGYVRFYDLSLEPGFPPKVGQERLAEAYSGIPGRVSIYGDNAYVATTNVGIQVVGIEQAKAVAADPDASTAIIGVYDSLGEGYGQPSDIITYGAAKALLTTNSGNLLVLDINFSTPQFMSRYQGTPHRIFRAGVAADYPYLDQYGNQQLDDIAVVGTTEGKVLTINLTDPYSPRYLATAKDKDGSELKTTVREISVSKESGLAFITTVNSVQVIDFKDPGNPRLLTEIATLPDPSGAVDRFGKPIMLPIGTIPAIVEKGGWVYLASQGQGLKVVDLDPHHLKTFPNPIILADSANGVALANVSIGYGIYPDKSFVPVAAYVVVYEEGNEIWKENVLLEGKGTVTFNAKESGRVFDINKKYESSIRLRDAIGVVVESEKKERIPFRWPLLSTDFNRDRIIDDTDLERTKKGDTFYFWVNDDDDSNEINGNNNPESGTNWGDDKVNGATDLEDFFPVHLKIKNAFSFYDPGTHNYLVKNADGALNFVITDLVKQEAGKYLIDPQVSLPEASRLANKATKQITEGGVLLNQYSDFMQQIKNNGDKGVILVEGRLKTSKPLVLEIVEKNSKNLVFSGQLNLSIAGVEQMFRHKNLIKEMAKIEASPLLGLSIGVTPIPGHPMPVINRRGKADRLTAEDFKESQDHFEGFSADKSGDFVHVHGYNVNEEDSRGEQAEVFKRLFWSGSNANFWGITWYGWDSQKEYLLVKGQRSPNYHINVRHAFNAGKLLKHFVTNSSPSPVNATFSAHSLGNMVVSTAIQSDMPYANYLMVNAAVAEEAYLERANYVADNWDVSTRPLMYNVDWRYPSGTENYYDPFLWQSEWYELFDAGDARSNLTWRNNFSSARQDNVYTFFAPTDEAFRPFKVTIDDLNKTPLQNVTAINPGDMYDGLKSKGSIMLDMLDKWVEHWIDSERLGTYGWSYNELLKGADTMTMPDSKYGGWGFNMDSSAGYRNGYCEGEGVDRICSFIKPEQANMLVTNPDVLKTRPLFDKSNLENSSLFSSSHVGSSVLTTAMRERMLANEIPALTFAVGHRGVDSVKINNIDIRDTYLVQKKAPWPRGAAGKPEWRHSDFVNVAYPYLYQLYDDFKQKSE